jgi:hypothetical protein
VSLLTRVVRLENRLKTPPIPVWVVLQKINESNEELVRRIRVENHAPDAMLIMVKFVEVN